MLTFSQDEKKPVNIISPHQDDAAFSLGLSIESWCRRDVDVWLINCFTVTDYAPLLDNSTRETAMRTRALEDITFCERLPEPIQIVNLHDVDSLLRLNLKNISEIFSQDPFSKDNQAYIRRLTDRICDELRPGVVLVPLAVCDHIDHIIAKFAAVHAARRKALPLGFYEDLPYAAEVASLAEYVARAETIANFKLTRVLVAKGTYLEKQRLVEVYRSQIDKDELTFIGQTALSGEWIWLPQRESGKMNFLTEPKKGSKGA